MKAIRLHVTIEFTDKKAPKDVPKGICIILRDWLINLAPDIKDFHIKRITAVDEDTGSQYSCEL